MQVKVEYIQNPPYNSNPGYSSNPAYPRPVEPAPDSGWFNRNQKNKPQSNSAGSAALIFISGGMNIALSTGFARLENFQMTLHMEICWFIAAIVGAVVGAVLCNILQKKLVYLFSSLLVTIGGILFVSLNDTFAAIVAARYLDGFANGLVLVQALVLIGEEAVKTMRGMLASSIETMCFSLGMYLQIIIIFSLDNAGSTMSALQVQGILAIVYGVLAFVIAFFLLIESPVFFLLRGQEEMAIDALRRLQRPFIVTTETYEQLQDHKLYIAMNKESSCSQSAINGLPALLKLCFYRGLNAMTFTVPVTIALLLASLISYGAYAIWPMIIFGTLRWVGGFFAIFMMDPIGRKKPMLFSALVCGGLAIGLGVIFDDPFNIVSQSQMSVAFYLLLFFQLFAGVYIASSSVYLSEAFPLVVKPFYIAIAFCVEMLVQIIICSNISFSLRLTSVLSDFFYALGGLVLVFFVLGIIGLPETKYLSLREAQDKFRRFISPR